MLAAFGALSIAPVLSADPPKAVYTTEPIRITRIGLPEPILYALSPRQVPDEEAAPPRRAAVQPPAPEPGAVFTPSAQGAAVRADEPLLTELRMLAELHAAHQLSGQSSDQAA